MMGRPDINGARVEPSLDRAALRLEPTKSSGPDGSGEDDEIWTVEDLARFLKVTTAAIYGMRYRREGPKALKVGRSLRWRKRDVLQWWEQQEPA